MLLASVALRLLESSGTSWWLNHDNELRGMRCHFHPGDEDLQASSALMQPLEALELLLSTFLQLPDKRRK